MSDGASLFGLRWTDRGMKATQGQIHGQLPRARGNTEAGRLWEFLREFRPLQAPPRYEGGCEDFLGVVGSAAGSG